MNYKKLIFLFVVSWMALLSYTLFDGQSSDYPFLYNYETHFTIKANQFIILFTVYFLLILSISYLHLLKVRALKGSHFVLYALTLILPIYIYDFIIHNLLLLSEFLDYRKEAQAYYGYTQDFIKLTYFLLLVNLLGLIHLVIYPLKQSK